MEGSLIAAITEHLHAAHERGVELAASESARAKASSDMAIVKSAIGEINEQKSQAEILKALVNRASSFAPRVAFFVIKGEQASGWRGRGFEGTVGDDAIQEISFSVNADTVIGSAAKGLATWSGGPGSHSEDHLLLNRLGEEPAQRIVAIPLKVRGRAVAVLYADSAGLDSESISLEALETLVTVSGIAVELLSAARGAAPKRAVEEAPAAAPVEEQPQSYEPTSEYTATAEPEPESVSEPSFTDRIQSYEPSYEATPSYESTPVEPSSFVEAVPVEETSGVFEDSSATAEQPSAMGEEPPSWSPSPVEASPAGATRRRYGQDAELPLEVHGD
jgi:hypothetical protein